MTEDEVTTAVERLCDGLRAVGVYHDAVTVISDDGRFMVTMECLVGEKAFSASVQDPVQHDFDLGFRDLLATARAEQFEHLRQSIIDGSVKVSNDTKELTECVRKHKDRQVTGE